MRHLCGPANVGDRTEGIGGSAKREQFCSPAELPLEIVPVELSSRRNHFRQPRDDPAVLFQRSPRRHVGMVIQLRQHNLVPRLTIASKSASEMKRKRRHVCSENDFVRGGVQKIGQSLAGRSDDCVGLNAAGKGPTGVGVVVQEVIAHRVGHANRNLRSAGTIKVSDRYPLLLSFKGWEKTPDLVYRSETSERGICHLDAKIGNLIESQKR